MAHSPHNTSHNSNSSSSQRSPSTSPGSSGGNKSRSFSISDILSDEIGTRKRPHPSLDGGSGEKSQKLNQPSIPFEQAPNIVISPVNISQARLPSTAVHIPTGYGLAYQPITPAYLPHPMTTPPHALPTSAFGLQLTPTHHPLVPVPPPPPLPRPPALNDAMCCDSLNLLSTVASHQQAMNTSSNSSISNTSSHLNNQLQEMQLNSRLTDLTVASNANNTSIVSHESVSSSEDLVLTSRKSTTPCILKHNRRKKREEKGTSLRSSLVTSLDKDLTSSVGLNIPSQSPLKSTSDSFSPSIFLSHPAGKNCTVLNSPNTSISPTSSREVSKFMTSTPVRTGDRVFISPSSLPLHSPISASKRVDAENSSSNESETPLLNRSRVAHRRPARACTSLSPLLENAHGVSHNSKSQQYLNTTPSSLLRSYSAYTPTSLPYHKFSGDSGVIPDMSTGTQILPMYHSPLHPALLHPSYQHDSGFVPPGFTTGYPSQHSILYTTMWGHSPVTDHLQRTGQIQSVPPWFICSDKKSDGKRLRLREAINKSLLESPTNTSTQLPPEWKTYAYGQTEDQRDLTQKARSFLRCRPRALKFDPPQSKPEQTY